MNFHRRRVVFDSVATDARNDVRDDANFRLFVMTTGEPVGVKVHVVWTGALGLGFNVLKKLFFFVTDAAHNLRLRLVFVPS